MPINTRKRILKNKWENVHLIEADARKVNLTGKFDGLLMFAAPDIYASEDTLSNILPHLRENARIVIFGAKISNRRFGWILNGLIRTVFNKLSFSSSPKLENKPWTSLMNRLVQLNVEEYFFGWMFLAYGNVAYKK